MNKTSKNILILALSLFISCIFSVVYFKGPDFDFYSYHYYNGWAFLNNRINIDFLPCLFRSYFNPILDALLYLRIEKLNYHPLFFILISGLKYGIFMFFAYKICEFIFGEKESKYQLSTVFCLIFSGLSPVLLYCISFDKNDIQVGIFLLIGLYLYLKNIFKINFKYKFYALFFSAFFMGLAIGLKYSCIASAVGLILATACIYKRIENPKKVFLALLAGIFSGFMITGLPWMLLVYFKFQNPFFPYFNNIFHSAKANFDYVLYSDFYHMLPKTFMDFIFFPLKNTLKTDFISLETKYYDIKFALGFIFCTLAFILTRVKSFEKKYSNVINFDIFCFILYFTVFTYYINLMLFGNYRYILVLFVLIPIIICFVLEILPKKIYYTCLLIILALFFITKTDTSHEKRPSSKTVFTVPDMQIEDNSTVLCGNIQACFFAPAQNKNIRYLGFSVPEDLALESYWNTVDLTVKNHIYKNEYLEKLIRKTFEKEKSIYFAYSLQDFEIMDLRLYEKALFYYSGINNIDISECKRINYSIFGFTPNLNIRLCKLK